ncbi:HMG box-containing protein C28F2.11 [Taphrina deformans PYCC 5710]|uniref:HMG box-containing protein C28F2.11 n=1 Tax=Taphrina deformans (strain PYCC 5710 / ATCC 11124 / CBS 356.35 / IMI 108563 / JCM 9778 / NBRC 8474) TaxID=1097556 RepID=R4XE67_TAPDE|nr:HMG box-containing protein C28F2.11 [Taphrina deformans PYCC 5710]|eukprot:CCG82740.1 HMG box-containing protein C28F2.11 [Taphrina deformans PYCC 5710]
MASNSTHSSQTNAERFADFHRKYQIVLSSCRLLTEAQSALDRSITDFVSIAQGLDPKVHAQYPILPNNSASPLQPATEVSQSQLKGKSGDSSDTVSKNSTASDAPIKKQKKVRDPDLPKRPMSAFFLFQNAVRNSVKSAMPEESKGTDIQKAISEKWRDLDDDSRQPYNERYENDVRDYEAKLATYKQDHGIPRSAKDIVAKSDAITEPKPDFVKKTDQVTNDDDAAAASIASKAAAASKSATATPKDSKKRARTNEKAKSPKKVEKPTEEKK